METSLREPRRVDDMSTEQDCVFCCQTADTEEHVIPKWLQRHFDLFNQKQLLWNGTTRRYRQAVVPACKRCNGELLAPLELRIQKSTASQRDYYLWAVKVQYGLSRYDATLDLDRANPGSGPLLPMDVADDLGEFVRHVIRGVGNPDFRFSPDPFGSVMLIKNHQSNFALIDVPRPPRAIAIALPPNRCLIVLPMDRGVMASLYRTNKQLLRRLQFHDPNVDEQLQLQFKLFGILTIRSHLAIPRHIHLGLDRVKADTVPGKLRTIPQSRDVYRGIARMLHLPNKVADVAYDRNASAFAADGWVRWRLADR